MYKRISKIGALVAVSLMVITSCSDKKSYADLLNEEDHAVNYFLAQHRVITEIPEDSIFEYGVDAPYYKIDEDGNVFMQVLNPGTKSDKVEDNEQIYFRYTRYNLINYQNNNEWRGEGNSLNMASSPTSFKFNNFTLPSSAAYGAGVQQPLHFLGVDCEVNVIIKSQLGFTEEIASVVPYMYNLRYFRTPL